MVKHDPETSQANPSKRWQIVPPKNERPPNTSPDVIGTAKPQQINAIQLSLATKGLLIENLGEVKMSPVHWVVPNFVPRGMLTLLAGHGGAGKSTLLAHLVACVTRGDCAFGLEYETPLEADVLIYNCEDAPAQVMVPRLHAAGADLDRVRRINAATGSDGKPIPFSPLHVDQLEEEFRRLPFGVLIIDPISSTVGNAGGNDNSETDVRPLLEGFAGFAERTKTAVIGVKHLGKGERENAAMRTQGSVVYTSVPRMVLALTSDKDDKTRRILARSKTNLPVGGNPGITFRTQQPRDALGLVRRHAPHLSDEDAETLAGQMTRCADFRPWDGDIDELVSGRQTREAETADRSLVKSCAEDWLRLFLCDGPKPSTDCVSKGNAAMETTYSRSWWLGILNDLIGGEAKKTGKGWCWRLPTEEDAKETQTQDERKEDGLDTQPTFTSSPSLDALKG